MAPKRNNMIPNVHLHKDWQRFIKTWFNQPARKIRRSKKRDAKAKRVAPRPVSKLRPIVRCPGIRYHNRTRLGKGFSIAELKAAGICKHDAMNIGVTVDHKRTNNNVEAFHINIQRLKEYKSKLILFPANKEKTKKTDSSPEECSKAVQLKGKVVMPLRKPKPSAYARVITDKERKFSCYDEIKRERRHARTWGLKAKKALEAAEDAAVTATKK